MGSCYCLCQNILTLTIFEGESKRPLPSRDDVEVINKHGVVIDYDIDKVVDDDLDNDYGGGDD